ncbi:MAG: HEPN domain-containing protein [Vicinamibacterales bacterium]
MIGRDAHAEAKRWIRFAGEDLRTAEALLQHDELIPRHACWLAGQAAEKAIKAGLVAAQIPFPFSHDLDTLRNLLPDGWATRRQHPDLAELTGWAVEARYPGDWPDATADEARTSVALARLVLESIWADLARQGVDLKIETGTD